MQMLLGLFTSTDSYRYFLKKGWLSVIGVFIFFQVMAGIIFGARLLYRTIPLYLDELSQAVSSFDEQVADGTSFTWQNNRLSVTQPTEQTSESAGTETTSHDLIIDYPPNFSATSAHLPQHLLTFSNQTLNTEQLQSNYNSTLIVVDPTTLFIKESNDIWREFALEELAGFEEYFSLTSKDILSQLNQSVASLDAFSRDYWYFIIALAPLLLLIGTIGKLLIDGLLLLILVQLNNYALTLSQTLQLTLLFGSIATVIAQIGTSLYPEQSLPFFSITFWLVALYVLVINRRRVT